MSSVAPIYVDARRVLLDALVALTPHRAAVIVAGAQAVYLHTGDADLAVAPYTTDGDLALDPRRLGGIPKLETAMCEAGFHLAPKGDHVEPGIWLTPSRISGSDELIPVDLIVPEAASTGEGTRGARLGPHGKSAARRAVGLEAALVDHAPMRIAPLDLSDGRSVVAKVAGPAALLVAKAHKIRDRVASGREDRVDDKDAADVLRLMQETDPATVARKLAELSRDELAGEVSRVAIAYLDELFGRRGRPGIEMAVRALESAIPRERIEVLCAGYVSRLHGIFDGPVQ